MACSDYKMVTRKVKVCRKPCKAGKLRIGKGGRCKYDKLALRMRSKARRKAPRRISTESAARRYMAGGR